MLVVVGASHRTAPLPVREKLAFPAAELPPALTALARLPHVHEAMLVSTCNRVEVYAATDAPATAQSAVRRFLGEARALDPETLARHIYDFAGDDAVRHLFRVAASLDSMIVGEPQILGQVKDAFGAARQTATVGPLLAKLVPRAFAVAKRVRTETEIARHPASVPAVAVDLARHIFGELNGAIVLLVGAGKMSDLSARRLRAAGASEILVCNRSPEKAAELARRVDGTARPWEALPGALAAADVVVSSTGATEPVLTTGLVSQAVRARKHRPLFLIDIAVPRDVEPAVANLPNTYLYDIDDLSRVVADNRKERQREAEGGERIVEAEVAELAAWARTQTVVPTIRALHERGEEVAHGEVDRAAARVLALLPHDRPELVEEVRKALTALADGVVGKLLHSPMAALKEAARRGDTEAMVDAARRLFAIESVAPPRDDTGTATTQAPSTAPVSAAAAEAAAKASE